MDLLWCTKYESYKKNDLGQPHGQQEAHPQGGHHHTWTMGLYTLTSWVLWI